MDHSAQDMLKCNDSQVPFLPQLHVQKPHMQRDKSAQSPGSSRRTPRLPPIEAGKEILIKEERSHGAYSSTRPSHDVRAQLKSAEWYRSSDRETSLEKLQAQGNTKRLPAKPAQRQGKMVGNTTLEFTPEIPMNQVPYKHPDEEAISSTTYFSKPRFGRRSVAQRTNVYRTRTTDELLDSEILAMEEKFPHVFAASDAPSKLKDLNGKNLGSSSVYKEDITRVLPGLGGQGEELSEEMAGPARRCHNTRARKRFLDALDLHYYNNFVATDPGRRMAVCEEIEHTIVVGDVSLAWYREHLRLQAVLDGWFL